MSEEMVDGNTGRKRSMVGGPRTEEGGGGGHGGCEFVSPPVLLGCMGLVVMG